MRKLGKREVARLVEQKRMLVVKMAGLAVGRRRLQNGLFPTETSRERELKFWSKVIISKSGCWEWCVKSENSGFNVFGKTRTIRVASWIFAFGHKPEGKSVCVNCGNYRCVNPSHLFIGNQGGSWMADPKNSIVGKKFSRLTVVCHIAGTHLWKCLCDCGNTTLVQSGHIKHGHKKSCGCLSRDVKTERFKTHNLSQTPEYDVWIAIKQRCGNRNVKNWKDYGGRGIKICREWRGSFEAFIKSVGRRPTPKHCIERKDNNGNYEPSNVKWATRSEQNRNHRRNRWIEFNGSNKVLSDWAKEIGIHPTTLSVRMKSWTLERALTTPCLKK